MLQTHATGKGGDLRWGLSLGREVEATQKHKEAREIRVELNIGGFRFETSVQACSTCATAW
jgi:hypothetical protein